MSGKFPDGHVLIYDDDHYYMGSVLAELLLQRGCRVTIATPAPLLAYWSQYTLEQERINTRLINAGVEIITQHLLKEISADKVDLTRSVSGKISEVPADAVVLVTDRISEDSVYQDLKPAYESDKIDSLRVIGDAEAPNIIAQAVFSGHLAAREFGEQKPGGTPFQIERVTI
jgi:dimethylamine/trimethylamine dehydrogenase